MPIVGRGRITPGTGEITYTDETGASGFATAIVNNGSSSDSGIVRSVTGNNLGVGFGFFAGTNGSRDIVLDFKSLVAGDGLTLSEDGSTITINQIGAPGTIRFSSLLEAPAAIITNGILFGSTPGTLDFIDPPDQIGARLTWTEDGFAWLPVVSGTVSSVGLTGRDGVAVNGSTITTSGVFTVGLEPTGVMAASYTAPTVTIDAFGRVTSAVSNTLGDLSKAANIGTGAGLYAGKVNGDLTFRSLRATGTATVSTVGDEIVIGSSGGVTSVAATGENGVAVSGGPITGDGTFTIRLTDTGVVPGTYASANVTVNAQGRVVYIEDGEPGVTSVSIVGTNGISATGGPITSSGTIALALTDTGVAANTYTAPTLTIDATGRITAATTNTILTDAVTLGSSGANIGGFAAGKSGSTLNLRRLVAVGGLALTETTTDIILDASGLGGSGSGGSSLNILDNGSLAGADIANLNFDGFNVHVTGNTATVSLELPGGTVTSVEAVGTNGVTVNGSPITETGTLTIGLSNTGVSANSYTHPNLTVDAQGRITAITSVTPSAVGTGQSIVANPATLTFKSIKGGTGVTVSATSSEVVIDASASGTVTSVNALGNNGITVSGGPITGAGTLTLGLSNTGVTATTYTFPSFTVDAQGRITSATGVTPTNLGTGQPVLASPSTLSFKTLKAGTNVTLDATTNEITINAAGGGTVTSVNATGSGGITVSGGPITGSGSLTIALGASGVTANSYTAPTISVDAQGRITSASSNSIVTAGANLGTTTTNAGLVFSSVTGSTANFRRIVGSGGLTVTQTASDIILDTSALTVADAIKNGISLGDGDDVFAGASGSTLQFKSLVAGSGVTLASTADEITITADAMTAMPGLAAGQYTSPTLTVDEYGRITAIINGASAVTGGANVGTGTASVYKDTSGNTLRFKTLKQGAGVTLTDNGNDITIASDALATIPGVQGADYTAPTISVDQYGRITAITSHSYGDVTGATNLSTNASAKSLFTSKTAGGVLQFKSILAGTNVSLNDDGSTITVAASTALPVTKAGTTVASAATLNFTGNVDVTNSGNTVTVNVPAPVGVTPPKVIEFNVDASLPQFNTSDLVVSMPAGFSISGTPTTNQVTITHNMGSYPINAVLHGVTNAGLVKVTPVGANTNNMTFTDTSSFTLNIQQFGTAGATTGGKLRVYVYF